MLLASLAHVTVFVCSFFLRKPRYPEQHDPHNVAERGVVFWKHLDPQSFLVHPKGNFDNEGYLVKVDFVGTINFVGSNWMVVACSYYCWWTKILHFLHCLGYSDTVHVVHLASLIFFWLHMFSAHPNCSKVVVRGGLAPRPQGLWIFEFLQIYGEKSCCWTMVFYHLLPRLGLQLHQYKSYSAWWYHCPYRRLFRMRLACERRSIVGKCTGCGTPRQVSDAWLMSWVGNFLIFWVDFSRFTLPETNMFAPENG